MAITYITGNPGSGKSYLAAFKIYKYFYANKVKPPKNDRENLSKYAFCYTNLNEFAFDKFDDVLEFNLDDFRVLLNDLYNAYQEKASDSELIKYCKDNKIFNALFVIDEAHNVFKEKGDDVLIWWLTYHRHLHQDIILITQNLSLVNTEYKSIAEFFYKAVDSGKRIFASKFRYIQYGSYKMTLNSIIQGGSLNLTQNDDVFNLYVSGATSSKKSFVRNYRLIFIVLILISIFGFFSLIQSFSSDDEKTTQNIEKSQRKPEQPQVSNQPKIKINSDEIFYFEISCNDGYCEILNGNYYEFEASYLNFLIENLTPLYIRQKAPIKGYHRFFIAFNKNPFINLIKRSTKDEKNSSLANISHKH